MEGDAQHVGKAQRKEKKPKTPPQTAMSKELYLPHKPPAVNIIVPDL